MNKDKKRILLAVLISSIMVISVMGLLTALPNSSASNGAVPSNLNVVKTSPPAVISDSQAHTLSLSQRAQLAKSVLKEARATGIKANDLFIPNYMSSSTVRNGHITLGYISSPAPMGVGDYGLMNVSGVIKAYNCTTSDIASVVNLSSLSVLTNDGTLHEVSMQLNAVLNNVDLFGVSNYSFWTQNVIDYSARDHLMCFVDNIWNFSSPTAKLTGNAINYSSAIANHEGYNDLQVGVHIGCGPKVVVATPFLLYLYLNTSLVQGKSTVWFNYSIPQDNLHGTYDEVEFNSTYGQKAGYSAPAPHYFISGTQLTPTGFIPYDAEMMIGGPGGGSTADIANISGTINLMEMNSTSGKFQNVKAAYDAGSETGETSVGVDVSDSGSTAILSSGPSLIYGLWNNTYDWTSYSVRTSDLNYESIHMTGNVKNNFAGDLMYMQTHASLYGNTNNISAFYAAYNATDLFLGFQENITGNSLVVLISNHSTPYGAENLSTYSPWGLSGMNTTFPVNDIFTGYFSSNVLSTNKFCSITSSVGRTITTASVPYSIVTSAVNNTTEIAVPLSAIMGSSYNGHVDVNIAAFVVGGSGSYVGTGIPFSQIGAYNKAPPDIFLVNNTIALYALPTMPFLFVNNNYTLISYDIWAWSPSSSFVLPTSSYYTDSFLNYYAPYYGFLTGGDPEIMANMQYNASYGVYTPMYITNNNDLKIFSLKGNGTGSNPYFLEPEGTLNPVFGQLNGYGYPVFQGLILENTDASVVVSNYDLSVPYVGYYAEIVNFFITNYGLDLFDANSPDAMIYNSSNVEIQNGVFDTWFSCLDGFSDVGSLVLWNSTNVYVYSNEFLTFGSSMLVYNPPSVNGAITIFQNIFIGINVVVFQSENYSISQQEQFASSFDLGTSQIGLSLYSGGDLIYMNEFVTQTPVISLDENYYTGTSAVYHDNWNNTTTGNAYWNYDYVTPFNESGLIQTGYDYFPDSFVTGTNLSFTTGLPYNSKVSVSVDGLLLNGVKTVEFYRLFSPGQDVHYYAEYMVGPEVTGQGSVIITNARTTSVNLSNVTLTNNVTFMETGLPSNTSWTVSIDGKSMTTKNTSMTFSLPDGNYSYSINSTNPLYVAHPASGYVNLTETMEVSTTFKYVAFNVTFKETGLPSGAIWYVNLSNGEDSGAITSSSYQFPLANGTYTYTIATMDKSYEPSPYSSSFTVNGTPLSEPITFSLVTYKVTFTETGLPSGATWYVNLSGVLKSSTGTNITFTEPNGTYSYSAFAENKTYAPTVPSGSVTVNGSAKTVSLTYQLLKFTLTLDEKGLSSGAKWYVNLTNGMSLSTTGTSISFNLTNGTYSYTATSSGYVNKTGSVTISGSSVVLTLSFTAVPPPVKVVHKPLSYLVYVLIVVIIATVVVAGLLLVRIRKQ